MRITVKNIGERIVHLLEKADGNASALSLVYVNFINSRDGLFRRTGVEVSSKEYKTKHTYSYPNCDYDPDDENSEKYLTETETITIGYGVERGQSRSRTVSTQVKQGEKPVLEFSFNQMYTLNR